MVNTNYIGSIVRILEIPVQKVVDKQILTTQFRVQLPQIRNNRIIRLVFWGSLARDVTNYYQVNDYIMIEGYLSFRNKRKNKSQLAKQNSKEAQITVSKIYPLSLNFKK